MKNVTVTRYEDEAIDNMIKRFEKAVAKDEVIKYARRHMEYESPSIKRKRKHQNALRRMAREKRKADKLRQEGIM